MPKPKASKRTSASERVRMLIDQYHAGNVTAAAEAAGVPYRSTIRLYHGSAQPRAELLVGLARHFGTTTEWLLTGEGAEPSGPTSDLLPTSQLARWYGVVESLKLPSAVDHAWRALPMSIGLAGHILRAHDQSPRTPAFVRAMGHEVWAWTMFLDEWIRIDGLEKVRRLMRTPENLSAARLGFAWFGQLMMQNDPDRVRRAIDAIAAEHALDRAAAD